MSAWSPDVLRLVLAAVDARMRPTVEAELGTLHDVPVLPDTAHVCLVGHRAAGKSTLLRALQPHVPRAALDLDALIAQRAGPIPELFRRGESIFRAEERAAFQSLNTPSLVACGGGFLSHHPDLLRGHVAVLVPVAWETFCERLSSDATRPRLRPDLPLQDELRALWEQRSVLHAQVPTWTVAQLLAALQRA